jgi:hypothetical protein
LRSGEDLASFSGIKGKGFLAENMFPGRYGVEAVLLVQAVRSADVHYINFGVIVDVPVVGVDGWLGVERCEVCFDKGAALLER